MSRTQRAIVLLVVQAVLVLSIAMKYLYERKVCPRVWVRAAQYDPSMPMRGRYLALQLAVDACALPRDQARRVQGYKPEMDSWQWRVKPVVQGGKLVPSMASDNDRPDLTEEVTVWINRPCDRATLSEGVDYFISDAAKGPFPLEKGADLWVEVTVPPVGPPRPIQLAISKDGTFTPLNLR